MPQTPSWLVWWEANRDPYLEMIHQGLSAKPDPKVVAKHRHWPTNSLLAALKSDSLALRASAALALGQMGEEKAFEPLAELARKDKEVQVRQAAIVAIGLLDIPEGEKILTKIAFAPLPRFTNGFADAPNDRQAALIALGLMRRLAPETAVKIQKMFGQPLVMLRRSIEVPDEKDRERRNKKTENFSFTMMPLTAWTLTRILDPADPAEIFHNNPYAGGIAGDKEALADGSSLAASAVSCWALAWHEDPPSAGLFKEALVRTNVPWIACEAILSMGREGKPDPAISEALAEILCATPKAKSLSVFRMLETQNANLAELWRVCESKPVRDKTAAGRSMYGDAFRKAIGGFVTTRIIEAPGAKHVWGKPVKNYLQLNFSGDRYDEVRYRNYTIRDYHWMGLRGRNEHGQDVMYHVNLGVEPFVMANLRASAAIALGRMDSSISQPVLRRVLAEKEEKKDEKDFDCFDSSVLYKSMAIMFLGRSGDVEAVPALVELVRPTAPRGVIVSRKRLRSPLRGFAALALGLYARPIPSPGGDQDRQGYDKICQLLAERVADAGEEQEFRAACALALGLSGRNENLGYLDSAEKTIGDRDDLLIGYVILARGMLGDKTVLELAKAFLALKNNRTDRNGILGRRAAVLGVGLTGSPEAVAILNQCWHLGYHVARETALAMTFCQGFNAAEYLTSMMKSAPKAEMKALAARCLGELFTKERPSRLTARLVNGSNYEMRIPRLTYYRALANEFLFTYLLAPSADEWETLCPQ